MNFSRYLSSFWNYIELAITVCALASLYLYFLRQIGINKVVAEFAATNGNSYIRLDHQRDLQISFIQLLSAVVFLTCMKLNNVLRFNRRIGLFTKTLSRAAPTILVFEGVFWLVTLAFDLALFIDLSPRLSAYQSLFTGFKTSIVSLLGRLQATEVQAVSQFGNYFDVIILLILSVHPIENQMTQ
ncbi:unnamed protein product [Anisakis simplex]|uniref:Location of vulva defective 1 (inferred by orthology to a C. elegans protein) n=1 Tax=Anisakis simplex TaxID=6269 RepID=A0A0M3JAZ7_ANISI|nr:unnamed protein product [Anisakis simplex]